MIEESSKSLWQVMRDRAANPLAGAFAIAWVAWNWRLLGILLLTDGPFVDRMRAADGLGLTTFLATWAPPLFVAVVWIVAYPFVARAATWWTERRRRETKLMVRRIRRDPLLSLDEARALRTYCRDVAHRHGPELERLGAQVEDLANKLRIAARELDGARTAEGDVIRGSEATARVVQLGLLEDFALAWQDLQRGSWVPSPDDPGERALYELLRERSALVSGRPQGVGWGLDKTASRALSQLIAARLDVLSSFEIPLDSPPRRRTGKA